jgi:hypothetical protein
MEAAGIEPRWWSSYDESQEDADLASTDARGPASEECHKQQAPNADDEPPAVHPRQLNVFDGLGDG